MVLLVGAGLLIRSFARLASVTPGFDARHVLSMQLAEDGLFRKYEDLLLFNSEMLELRAACARRGSRRHQPLPAAWANYSGHGIVARRSSAAEFRRGTDDRSALRDAGLFRSAEHPLEQGRVFTERDRAGAPFAVVVNAALVRQTFPNEDPLGKRLYIQWGHPEATYEIVGVVGDVRQQSLDQSAKPGLYLATLQEPTTPVYLVARTLGDPNQLARAIQAEIHSLNRAIPISDVRTMDAYVADSVSAPRFQAILLGGFAALAVLLASVGIFGVISYAVAQRTREIGVRRALGAGTAGVMSLVLVQALALAGIGIVIGLAGALAVSRVLRTMLFGITPTDTLTFAGVSVTLLAVAFLARYLPARRAARIDPMSALRYE